MRAARDHFNLPVDRPPPGGKRRSVAKKSGAARDAAGEAAALETLSTDWEEWKSLRLFVVLFSLDNEGTLVKIMRGCERAELEEQKAWDEFARPNQRNLKVGPAIAYTTEVRVLLAKAWTLAGTWTFRAKNFFRLKYDMGQRSSHTFGFRMAMAMPSRAPMQL